MPPVYTAFFLWAASAILWWSGWRTETADGIPHRAVAVFLAGWPLAASRAWTFGEGLTCNGAFVWTGLAVCALLWRMTAAQRWTSVSAGLLTGSLAVLCVFARELWPQAPDWLMDIGSAAAAGLGAAFLAGEATAQIAALTLGLAVTEGLQAAWHPDLRPAELGTGRWMESWWTAALAARLPAILSAVCRIGFFGGRWRREGERSR